MLSIVADELRIVDDTGGPYLYAPQAFDVVDPTEPSDWISERGEDGERYAHPAELSARRLYADWHDKVASARATVSRTSKRCVGRRRAPTTGRRTRTSG